MKEVVRGIVQAGRAAGGAGANARRARALRRHGHPDHGAADQAGSAHAGGPPAGDQGMEPADLDDRARRVREPGRALAPASPGQLAATIHYAAGKACQRALADRDPPPVAATGAGYLSPVRTSDGACPATAAGGGRRRCQAGIHLRPPWAADPAGRAAQAQRLAGRLRQGRYLVLHRSDARPAFAPAPTQKPTRAACRPSWAADSTAASPGGTGSPGEAGSPGAAGDGDGPPPPSAACGRWGGCRCCPRCWRWRGCSPGCRCCSRAGSRRC